MYNSLFHVDENNCNGPIYLDLTARMRLVASPIITQSGIKIGTAEFVDVDSTASVKEHATYFCTSCDTKIVPTDVLHIGAMCTYCGLIKSVDQLYKGIDDTGNVIAGYFCMACAKKKELKTGNPLNKIISKIITQR